MENSQQTCFSFRWHTPIPPDHPIGSNYRLCSMCLYIVWPVLPAAVGPCIPSQAVMEARCLPVCLRLIINSLTQNFSPSLSSVTACYERICGLSVLQTSGSVSKVRLTNWIPLVSFCLEGGVDVARVWVGEKRSLLVTSTSYKTLQPFSSSAHASALGFRERCRKGGFPWKKGEKSVQINNLKWHSEWHSASTFPVTVSCSQTGLLYISMSELVLGETLWSTVLFSFFTAWGEVRRMYTAEGYYRKRPRCGDWSVQVVTSNL